MKSEPHTPSIPPILWCLLHQSKESVLGRHWAYFLAGWVILLRFDCRVPKTDLKNNWSDLLSLAGPRYWPLVLGGFVFLLVGLLILLSQTLGYAQPLLIAAGTLSEWVWWLAFFLGLCVWRYQKGQEYLQYCAKLVELNQK